MKTHSIHEHLGIKNAKNLLHLSDRPPTYVSKDCVEHMKREIRLVIAENTRLQN